MRSPTPSNGSSPRTEPAVHRRCRRCRTCDTPGVDLHAAGSQWAIATPHTLATEAGAVAFERGGNALDAAIAAAVTLAVCYPHNCGVGGDLFALVQRPDGATIAINASGRAPSGVDPDALRARYGSAMPEQGPDSITVPGAVSGWSALHDEGRACRGPTRSARRIALAFGGVSVSRSVARALEERKALLAADPGSGRRLLPRRRAASPRRALPPAGARRDAATDRGRRAGRALRRRGRRTIRRRDCEAMGSPMTLRGSRRRIARTSGRR